MTRTINFGISINYKDETIYTYFNWCIDCVRCLFTSCEDMENEPLEIQSDIYVWDEDDYTGENANNG